MRGYLVFIILILTIGCIIGLAIISYQTKPSTFKPSDQKSIAATSQGIIDSISDDGSNLMLVTQSGQGLTVVLGKNTVIKDKNGTSLTPAEIHKGFRVQVKGKALSDTQLNAQEVIITSMPNVLLYSPGNGSGVTSSFEVSGIARVVENVVSLRIRNIRSGKILLTGTLEAKSPHAGQYGPYSERVTLSTEYLKKGDKIEVTAFQPSAKDGSEIGAVHSIVTFDSIRHIQIKAYFTNDTLNPSSNCQTVFPVIRDVPATTAVAKVALQALLDGPSDNEVIQGYGTAINDGVLLNSIIIKDETAYADFSQTLQKNVGGSCRVTAMRSQITQTLKQFPTIKNVVMSINGEKETSLQP